MPEEGELVSYLNQTVLHPLGLLAVILLGLVLLLVPRRWACLPMFIMACFIAPAQRLAVASLNFDLLRLMLIWGLVRLVIRREYRFVRLQRVDFLLILWALVGAIVFIIQQPDGDAIKYRSGVLYDTLGMYFLFRCLVQSWDDFESLLTGIAWLSIPVAMCFWLEHITGRNLFACLGGVAEITVERMGHLRCQGAFAHPLMAGCFWSAWIPSMLIMAWRGRHRVSRLALTLGGLGSAGLIIVACASSTPAMAVIFTLAGLALFPLRHAMRPLRWALVLVLLILHLTLNGPVWGLLSHIDLVGGSTGWHRYKLIDEAIDHLDEWWLMGVRSTAHWADGLFDLTNQYILEGTRGGIWAMGLFIALIADEFALVGRLWRRNPERVLESWALGVTLWVHVLNFLAVSYFGQIYTVWYLLLALIPSLVQQSSEPQILPAQAPRKTASTVEIWMARRTAHDHNSPIHSGGSRAV